MDRRNAFIRKCAEKGLDAAILHRRENMRYLTGFTGEGCVFVCADETVIITDFRYTEQAQRQSPTCRAVMTTFEKPEKDWARELTDAHGVRTLGLEEDFLSYTAREELAHHMPFVQVAAVDGLCEELRTVKDDDEIESICRACEISCRAFENLLGKIHAGMTERQVRTLLDFEMLSLGSEGNAFDTIAAAGINGSLPHAVPTDHVIENGELLTLDFGAKYNGYCSDMTRTIGFGKITGELREVYDLVLDAHLAALHAVRPGITGLELDKIARDMIDARYPGTFGHSLGHGVGLFIHEQPRASRTSHDVFKKGHVITVEPGVYIPGFGGCRIEDTAILTSDGYLDPVTSPKHLIEL